MKDLKIFSSKKDAEEWFRDDRPSERNRSSSFRHFLKPVNRKTTPVRLLDLQGNVLKKFPSRTEAEKELGQRLDRYINTKKVFRESFLVVSETGVSKTTRNLIGRKRRTPVLLFDLQGNVLKKFPSRTEAEKELGQRLERYINTNAVFSQKFLLLTEKKEKRFM